MSAIAPLSLSDGSQTAVTYNPASKDGNSVTWTASASSVQLQPKVYVDGKGNLTSGNTRRIKSTVSYPFVDTNLNNESTYKTGYINVEIVLPRTMASADVAKLRNIGSSLMLNSIIAAAIDDAQNPY
jgi:hypothetical protein